MDFKDSILQFASRVESLCTQIKTEEATKNALIMPFIQLMGYDVFNPIEVNPEFIADIGIKKGEKVDYAIMKDAKPIILIECKHYSADLNPHNSQLFRYFHTSEARFGLLTNGINFKFYTDLVTPNKMDDKPFFEFRINEIKDNEIDELKKFSKSYFDVDNIANTASELKYMNTIRSLIYDEFNTPSDEFVRFFAKKAYPGSVTAKIVDQFTPLTKRAFSVLLSEMINSRLKNALDSELKIQPQLSEPQLEEAAEPAAIVTTDDEKEAFLIVRAVLRQIVEPERVVMRDQQTYCGINFDDNNRRPVCRLHFGPKRMFIEIPVEPKKFARYELKSINDIYNYSKDFLSLVESYLADNKKLLG